MLELFNPRRHLFAEAYVRMYSVIIVNNVVTYGLKKTLRCMCRNNKIKDT